MFLKNIHKNLEDKLYSKKNKKIFIKRYFEFFRKSHRKTNDIGNPSFIGKSKKNKVPSFGIRRYREQNSQLVKIWKSSF